MKTYTIIVERSNNRKSEFSGTIENLIEDFSYTLEVGKSWEKEKGNKKINTMPKTIKSLVSNLNNASNNAASNGYSGTTYYLKE